MCFLIRTLQLGKTKTPSYAEAFTVKAMMKNSIVKGPKKAGAFKERPAKPSLFRIFYDRGDLPVAVRPEPTGNKISWKVDIVRFDYSHLLPIFFDGLSETTMPYEFFARQGIHDLLDNAGPEILHVIPHIILPIRKVLNTRNRQVIRTTLKILQHLIVAHDGIGEALVPYYPQILPVLNLLKNMNVNLGDGIDYGQQKRENIGNLILESWRQWRYTEENTLSTALYNDQT
uniref:Uncharacterized protein n=1 Tax=Leptobrachium leishanense TaxID=445787 RepID=A0A8C5QC56_9ANUR